MDVISRATSLRDLSMTELEKFGGYCETSNLRKIQHVFVEIIQTEHTSAACHKTASEMKFPVSDVAGNLPSQVSTLHKPMWQYECEKQDKYMEEMKMGPQSSFDKSIYDLLVRDRNFRYPHSLSQYQSRVSGKHNAVERELVALNRDMRTLANDKYILSMELVEVKQNMERKNRELDSQRKEILDFECKNKELVRERDESRQQIIIKNDDIMELRKKVSRLENENEALKAEKRQMQLQSQCQELETKRRVRELERNVNDTKAEVHRLQMEKQNLTVDLKLEKEWPRRQFNLNSNWTEEKLKVDKQINELNIEIHVLRQKLKQQEDMARAGEEKSARKIKDQEREIESLRKALSVFRRKNIDRQNEDVSTDLNDQVQRLLQEKTQFMTEKKKSSDFLYEREHELQIINRKLQNTVDNQNKEIKELEDKIQSLVLKNQRSFTDLETCSEAAQERELELQSMNRKLQYTVDKQKHEIKELDDKIQSLMIEKQYFTDLETSVDAAQKGEIELKRMNINLQTTVDKQRKEITGLNDKMQQHLREKDLLSRELEYNKEIVQTKEREHESLKTKLQNQNKEHISLKMQIEELDRKLQEANRMPSHRGFDELALQQRLDDASKRIRVLQEELDDTKSRLSRAIGDKLTDNNPNIADLSDKNRPTKLSERYQELYDNQWTDAFEIIEKTCENEEEAIQKLKNILMETASFCKQSAEDQMTRIKDVFSKGQDIPANIMKPLKDCRKALAELYGKTTFKDCLEALCNKNPDTAATLRAISPFIKECYEICWLMAVQDPPVAFGPEVPPNGKFDKDCYKAYTRNGERVEFVVWPVLVLHQGGPVLCKGVAQGFLS